MKKLIGFLVIACLGVACSTDNKKASMEPPVRAPFEKLDTLAVNDWWNRASNPIVEMKVERKDAIAFGIYTVSNNTLKLSAQLYPLYPSETRDVRLEIKKGKEWTEVQKQTVNDIGWSALFRVENWDHSIDQPYRFSKD